MRLYFFHTLSHAKEINLQNQIDIAMRKVTSNASIGDMLTNSFNKKIKDFIASNQAFSSINSIEGTPD